MPSAGAASGSVCMGGRRGTVSSRRFRLGIGNHDPVALVDGEADGHPVVARKHPTARLGTLARALLCGPDRTPTPRVTAPCGRSRYRRAGGLLAWLSDRYGTRGPHGALQGKICPGTSQFNGGTSHLISKRWDGRTTPPEIPGTPVGTMLGPGCFKVMGVRCYSQSSPPELWEEGYLFF